MIALRCLSMTIIIIVDFMLSITNALAADCRSKNLVECANMMAEDVVKLRHVNDDLTSQLQDIRKDMERLKSTIPIIVAGSYDLTESDQNGRKARVEFKTTNDRVPFTKKPEVVVSIVSLSSGLKGGNVNFNAHVNDEEVSEGGFTIDFGGPEYMVPKRILYVAFQR